MRYQKTRIIPPKNAHTEPQFIDAQTIELDPARIPAHLVKRTDPDGTPAYVYDYDAINGWANIYVRLDA